jgi:hypothetical protein
LREPVGASWASRSFDEKPDAVTVPARAAAQSGADAILIGEGGGMLQAIGPALGAAAKSSKLLGTGLWDDASCRASLR